MKFTPVMGQPVERTPFAVSNALLAEPPRLRENYARIRLEMCSKRPHEQAFWRDVISLLRLACVDDVPSSCTQH